jgi:hypothetical protein
MPVPGRALRLGAPHASRAEAARPEEEGRSRPAAMAKEVIGAGRSNHPRRVARRQPVALVAGGGPDPSGAEQRPRATHQQS